MTNRSIPNPSFKDPNAKTAHEAVREQLQVMMGERGDPLDKVVTMRMLQQDPTLASHIFDSQYADQAGTLAWAINSVPSKSLLGQRVVYPVDMNPAALAQPTGLHASGALANIILDWDLTAETNYSHYEVWRAASDNVGVAVRIGTTQSSVYVDNVGTGGLTYYYWVRGINTSGLPGPYSASASSQTGKAQNTDIADAVITDRMVAANAAINGAKIADATITNAKIGQTIQSTNFVPNTSGWRIDKVLGLEVNTGTTQITPSAFTLLDGSGGVLLSSGSGVGPAFEMARSHITDLGTFAGIDQLTPANISTYIQAAAIGNALIGNAAVDTLQIASNAVTVPTSTYSGSTTVCLSGVTTDLLTATVAFPTIAPSTVTVLFTGNMLNAAAAGQIIWFELLRGSTVIAESYTTLTDGFTTLTMTMATADVPGTGTHTYKVRCTGTGGTYAVAAKTLIILGTKR